MKHPTTVFDRPQWNLLPDPAGVRSYANVNNRLEVTRGSAVYAVALAVPTELFTLMREVLHVPIDSAATLSMDLLDGWYVFSLMVTGGEGGDHLYDLWAVKQLPEWFNDRSYRV